MHNEQKVTDSIYWIGGNDFVTPRFENYIPITKGVSYNSYFIDDEKTCVLDAVDNAARDLFMDNIACLLKGRPLDYIVVNHMEPDHSGSLLALMKAYPEAKLCASPAALKMFEQYFHIPMEERYIRTDEKTVLELGHHTLRFITAPMVHWPEVTFTYEEKEKILFSADAFGTFGVLHGSVFADAVNFDEVYGEEIRIYYMNVISKYGVQVLSALEKLKKVELKMICSLHGPVYRKKEDIEKVLDLYRKMASWEPEEKSVTFFFASPYGNTALAVQRLAFLLGTKGIKNMKLVDLSSTPATVAWTEAEKRSHMVLAAPTMDMGLNPMMENFLEKCSRKNIRNRKVAIIGNSSWAPYVSIRIMKEIVLKWKNCPLLGEGVHIVSAAGEKEEADLESLAEVLAEDIMK